jgi:hypothetical protein
MTIINNIEIDNINYKKNIIKDAIINNDPIENKLNVIIVVSNPCQFASRYILAREFIKRFESEESNVNLFIVEMIYPQQQFLVTDSKNKRHLQLKTEIPIWHKENMINIGVNKLLPKNWKAFAWIDADIEFENVSWALDTLKILNGTCDIVQLYSHCVDTNEKGVTNKVFNSFGYKFSKGDPYTSVYPNYWHPGFAWACTRKAYQRMGGLFDYGILGSGDNIMAYSLINNALKSINEDSTDDYKDLVIDFQNRVKHLRLGYVPGVIKHYFHGSKVNRKYTERWLILVKHLYSPKIHFTKDKDGIIIPTKDCPLEMLDEIYDYFKARNEDEFLK